MEINERSYSGKIYRPKPEIHLEGDGSLLIIATPWGARSGAQKSIEIVQDYFQSAKDDIEATSPFQKLSCLSPLANNLRVSIQLANDILYREENKQEYSNGIEICAIAKTRFEWAIIQIGQPNILLDRRGLSLISFGNCFDQSVDLSNGNFLDHPLPLKILGTDPSIDPVITTIRPQKGDRLVLTSRSLVPPLLMTLKRTERELDNIANVLIEDREEMPFWAGLVS